MSQNKQKYSDRFIPMRDSDVSSKDLHPYQSLIQNTDDLIAEALALDPSLSLLSEREVNIERISQLALTQHKRTSFLIEKIIPKQKKLLKYSKKENHNGLRSIMVENENEMRNLWSSKKKYKVKQKPIKILEAPGLLDDYYLNLVVWGNSNIIGVGLEDSVYFYVFNKNKIIKHFDCSEYDFSNQRGYSSESWPYVCSMSFNSSGDSLAVADSTGKLSLTDVGTNKVFSQSIIHNARIGSIHWQNNLLVSGSRDSCVHLFDIRNSLKKPIHTFTGHHQEICGLKLSPDDKYIASGGNDNECNLWSIHKMKVILLYLPLIISSWQRN
jgi:cell division cycle 20-like protein 1 (cofactor of APC complex)